MRRPLLVAILLVALALVGRPAATAGAATCTDPSADHVAVVIDFGTLADAPRGVTPACVPFAPRDDGMDVLRSVAPGQVVTDSSGKVCAIFGYPADTSSSNCSAPHDGRIRYWAYFLGTAGGWTYSASGAAAVRVAPEVVQGWRYIDVPASGGTSGIVPPRDYSGSPSYLWSTTCPPPPPPTTRPAATLPAGPPPTEAPGASVSPSQTSVPKGAEHPTTSVTRSGASTSTVTRGPTSLANGAIAGLRSDGRARRLTPAEVRAATAASPSKGSWLGEALAIVAGVVVIGALLGAGVWRSRRRLAQD
jgi:hypothetical protein